MSETSNFTDNNLHPEILCDCLSRCDGIGSMHGFHDVDCPRHPKNISAAPPAPSEQQDRLEAIKRNQELNVKWGWNRNQDIDWLLSRLEKARALADKYKRRARVDCDPANGSAEVQTRGRLEAEFSKQLLTALRGDDRP